MEATKVLLVTGGSSGIGAATALRFVREGWRVAITGRSEKAIARLRAEVGANDDSLLTLVHDVCDGEASHQAVVATVLAQWGRLDACFVNAGIYYATPIGEATQDDWDSHIATNLTGAYHTIRTAIPAIRDAKGLFILNASIAGLKGYANNSAYGATKWGLRGIGETLRAEEAKHGVRVTVLFPGPVDTPIWDALESRTALSREAMVPAEGIAELVWTVAANDRMQVDELVVTPVGYLR